ncbi:ABC transporter permease [Mycobacterium aquaticum]|uniref:Peptide ABC transporter permease n=1 Tax=Mycobacterium aquaticum TaxID=1927124 RepID=A0A1X0BAC4_9MYCO|nr:ABC transporter permease [Mycobacterium aquaticum]ORA39292.1 peptide ABC transporter permease [Mycobacterium aquaticum]
MRRYALNRLGQAVLVLWAAYTLSFILLSALPGDAVRNRIANPDAQITPEAAQVLLNYYGLNRPLWEQYLGALTHLLRGDLGFSLTNGQTVTALLSVALPNTLRLAGLALFIAVALAAVIAVLSNYAPRAWARSLTATLPALFASVPTFVVGILALQFFSFGLHLIPASDDGSFAALIGPAVTLGILITAPLAQVFITSIGKTRTQAFVHVLSARGADERYIFTKGVLRNSSLPVLTLLGLACGELVAGAVVTEAVFARSGVGQLTVAAVSTQDLPVLQGVVLVATLTYVMVNLAVDLAYPFLDPRILASRNGARDTRVARREPTAARLRRPAHAEAVVQ